MSELVEERSSDQGRGQRAPLRVVSEPRVYSEHGPNSYFRDVAIMARPGWAGYQAAQERLKRHAQEVAVEIRSGSAEGQVALRSARETVRDQAHPNEELRGITSGSGSFGSLVTPQYLTDLYAAFRSPDRVFTNRCLGLPIPEFGMEILVPAFATADAVTQQSAEGVGTADTNPTSKEETVVVTTQSGQVVMSQQLFDRGGYDGAAFDVIAIKQMTSQLGAAIDLYVINAATANAGSVPDPSAVTVTSFYADVSAARELLTDTAGTRLMGTHVFSTTDFVSYIEEQVDSEGRPIVVPYGGPVQSQTPDNLGAVGVVLPGSLLWYADDNIPSPDGTNTQILVARPQEVLVWEGAPISFSYPEPGAPDLSVVVGIREYVACLPRYPKCVSVISGAGYPLSLT